MNAPEAHRIAAVPLRGARLDLEPLRLDHAAELAQALADHALHAFIGGTPLPEPELSARYRRLLAGSPDPGTSWCNWTLRLRAGADGSAGTVGVGGTAGPVAGTAGTTTGARGATGTTGATTGARGATGTTTGARGTTGTTGTATAVTTTGPAVGTVQATVTSDGAEVAWVVGTPWQGHGLAREAAVVLTDWLRERGVPRLVAHVHPEHHASAAVATAAGLAPTEVFHERERRWEWRR
ncbi:GNAT family N-acetyltransferase [Streptomyces roseoviridis]|uniref:GNAT family N-acetyltransferase n=1 Tax=Streptomyces roseoviridis TaxID=67361 RepID=A0ABV5R0V7_9ACTN